MVLWCENISEHEHDPKCLVAPMLRLRHHGLEIRGLSDRNSEILLHQSTTLLSNVFDPVHEHAYPADVNLVPDISVPFECRAYDGPISEG